MHVVSKNQVIANSWKETVSLDNLELYIGMNGSGGMTIIPESKQLS